MTQAVILDFDGVVLDTEMPYYTAWREVFEDHGHALPLTSWHQTIGTQNGWDPHTALEELVGPLDRVAVRERRYARFAELMQTASILDGVHDLLDQANALGLRLGVASSSSYEWVLGFLKRFDLVERFASIRCFDDSARAKPAPDLYVKVLDDLAVEAGAAIAIEDSPNGIRAAKAAGIFCVAVPCEMTRGLDLGEADLVIESLAASSLTDLLGCANARAN